jgi:hypothetical protein
MSLLPPQEGGSGLRNWSATSGSFLRTADASLRREENSEKETFFGREDHPLTSVPVCRKQFAEVTRSCVVKEIVSLSRQDNDEA